MTWPAPSWKRNVSPAVPGGVELLPGPPRHADVVDLDLLARASPRRRRRSRGPRSRCRRAAARRRGRRRAASRSRASVDVSDQGYVRPHRWLTTRTVGARPRGSWAARRSRCASCRPSPGRRRHARTSSPRAATRLPSPSYTPLDPDASPRRRRPCPLLAASRLRRRRLARPRGRRRRVDGADARRRRHAGLRRAQRGAVRRPDPAVARRPDDAARRSPRPSSSPSRSSRRCTCSRTRPATAPPRTSPPRSTPPSASTSAPTRRR